MLHVLLLKKYTWFKDNVPEASVWALVVRKMFQPQGNNVRFDSHHKFWAIISCLTLMFLYAVVLLKVLGCCEKLSKFCHGELAS